MANVYSLNSNVKFPNMEYYDMDKASDMALYWNMVVHNGGRIYKDFEKFLTYRNIGNAPVYQISAEKIS